MNSTKNMKQITVEEFLEATKGEKRYKFRSSDLSGVCAIIKGDDISLSFRMDTVDEIIAYEDGSFKLSYGAGSPQYTFRKVKEQ